MAWLSYPKIKCAGEIEQEDFALIVNDYNIFGILETQIGILLTSLIKERITRPGKSHSNYNNSTVHH